jgi:hypothetical protein
MTGEIRGTVTVVQESRFRVQDAQGRGYLFTLGRKSGVSLTDLHRWHDSKVPITVRYEGAPDLGAVAVQVRAWS